MSPLWSDGALAKAAWAKAVDAGLVDDDKPEGQTRGPFAKVRRMPQPRRYSFAL